MITDRAKPYCLIWKMRIMAPNLIFFILKQAFRNEKNKAVRTSVQGSHNGLGLREKERGNKLTLPFILIPILVSPEHAII